MSQPTLFGVETWKYIPGWEDTYMVSTHGNVHSLDRTLPDGRRYRGKELSPYTLPFGYLKVNLSRDAVRYSKFVHRLVLEAFIGPCPPGMETRHLNGNPADNRLENLTWGTPGENNSDIVSHGRHGSARKTYCPQGHPLGSAHLNAVGKVARKCLSCKRAQAMCWRRPEFEPYLQRVSDIYYEAISRGEDTSVIINERLDREFPGVRSGKPARYSGRKRSAA